MNLEALTDKEFEHLCKWVARDSYGPNVFLYERYNQNGIDAYWINKGKYYVIQSKQRSEPNPSELIGSLESDFDRAKQYFGADLKQFIFATTGSLEIISTKVKRTNGLIESVLDVCTRLSVENNIDVIPWHWNYLKEKVLESPFLLWHLLNRGEGAILINDNFFQLDSAKYLEVNERECKIEYYGGQEDIQWHGIYKQWDAPREVYNNAIDSVTSAFKYREPIAAIIRGDGGSGKSVLLRRLSFDLRNDYTVYWIGSNLDAFMANELIYDVQRHPAAKYLIILEDWYRNIERADNNAIANQFLNEIKRTPNAKLIIGDRKGKKKIYDDFILSKNIYDLNNTENTNLLKNIFKQMPEWQNLVTDEELKDITEATLFVILFVFCYGEKHSDNSLTERYKRIFKSDYNKLLETNDTFWKGIANALYLYANIYSIYGIMLSMRTIIEIACYYNNCAIPLKYQLAVDNLAEIPLLKKYIRIEYIQTKTYGTIQRVRFNHDTVAELGWATKHELVEMEYNENVIDDLMIIARTLEDLSDVGEISFRLSKRPGENGKKAARNYLKTKTPEKSYHIFGFCINLLKNEEAAKQVARDFLKADNPHVIFPAFCTCVNVLENEEVAKQAARDFLEKDKPHLNYQAFCLCLNVLKGEEVAKQAARDFLKTDNPNSIKEAFCTCLDLLKGEEVAKQAARDFLEKDKPHLNYQAFCLCLNVLKNEEVAKQAARDFLKTDNPNSIKEAFCTCLNLLKGEEVAKQAARDFLKTDNPHVNYWAFCTCLDLLKGEEVAKQAARDFLTTDNPQSNNAAFCSCLAALDIEAESLAAEIVADYKTKNWSFVYNSLKILGKTSNYNDLIEVVVEEIIANRIKGWFHYKELLKIPLFNIPAWVGETQFLIDNWRQQTGVRRNNLNSIFFSYHDFPEKLQNMSIGIIRNWNYELTAQTKHKAYFTRCLANINVTGSEAMKKEVIQICKDIVAYQQNNRLELTYNLEEWIKRIATTGEFPTWNFEEI
jgi:hypothetical protein